MSFTKKSADLTPIVDTVFAIVSLAKKDIAENGADVVTDATIGSLYNEEGQLVAFDTVFDHYDAIDHRVKAAYASSFTGNPDYRENVYTWVTQNLDLPHSVIATPGGSGVPIHSCAMKMALTMLPTRISMVTTSTSLPSKRRLKKSNRNRTALSLSSMTHAITRLAIPYPKKNGKK